MSEQGSQTDDDVFCMKCGTGEGTFVNLQCDHIFCILCVSFMYAKSRKQLSTQSLIKCVQCQNLSNLDQEYIQLIKSTLEKQVLPNIDPFHKLKTSKSRNNLDSIDKQQGLKGLRRKIKSEEHSFELVGTESSANKAFMSKFESPKKNKSNQQQKNKDDSFCDVHCSETITHVCFTCDVSPICLKCLNSSRKHLGHQVKQIEKARKLIMEQMSGINMEIKKKVEENQLIQKRLNERVNIIKERAHKFINSIKSSFEEILMKLQEKRKSLIQSTEQHFTELIEQVSEENERICDTLELLRSYQERISESLSEESSILKGFMALKEEMSENTHHQYRYLNEKKKVEMPSDKVLKELEQIKASTHDLKISLKFFSFSKIQPITALSNCVSEGKMKLNKSQKRIKTNLGSLNSSGEKKRNKNTRTEEDEKNIKKVKQNAMIMSTGERNSRIPAYVTDYINKKGHNCSSNRKQMISPNLETSSKIGRLSKTVIIKNQETGNKNKKEKKTLVKQRLERKTQAQTQTQTVKTKKKTN